MPSPQRAYFETRFGADFSKVRIHTSSAADRAARSVAARAFTVGPDISFASGEYRPTAERNELIAHELVHVIQQGGMTAASHQVARSISQTRDQKIMRQALPFASSIQMCHQYLKSRVFTVNKGGLRVSLKASWGPKQVGDPMPHGCSHDRKFSIELRKKGWVLHDPYGTCAVPAGVPTSRQWTNLPRGEYFLEFNTPDTGPYCCLRGPVEVSEESGPTGGSCTVPPAGPLELLHSALDIAGLVPVLGAIPDAINAGIYAVEGDWVNAGLSAVAMAPVLGEGATIAKIGGRTVVKANGTAIKATGKQKLAQGFKDAKAAQRKVDPKVAESVERGIVESSESTIKPAAKRKPRPAPKTSHGEAARKKFDKLRDGYAKRLGVKDGGQVHHAVELQVLDRYPGVFKETDLNAFGNMRGIVTENAGKRQLHNSKIREIWDRHYVGLDDDIARLGLKPGTPQYNTHVRRYLEAGRGEIDHVLGQFFTESRKAAGLP